MSWIRSLNKIFGDFWRLTKKVWFVRTYFVKILQEQFKSAQQMLFSEFSSKNIRDFVQWERQSPAHFPLQIFDQLAVQFAQLDPTTSTECEQHGGEVEGAVQHVVAVGEFGVFAVFSHVFVVAQERVSDLKFRELIPYLEHLLSTAYSSYSNKVHE